MSTINIELKPFSTPNFVILKRQNDGDKENKSFPLKELDSRTLSDMCDEFRKEVFKKAEKEDPEMGK